VQVRHEPICQKAQQKKRKVFDSSKQRAEGTDVVTTKKRGQPSHQSRVSICCVSLWHGNIFEGVGLCVCHTIVVIYEMAVSCATSKNDMAVNPKYR